MLKLTSLVLGFLTVITMAPSSQAATVNPEAAGFGRAAGELHAQMIRRDERREVRNERRHVRNERREVRHERHERRHERREGRRHY
jgi:hypothetical protein